MTFTVEDGTGTNPLANSYITVQELKDYWADRGVSFTVASGELQVALVKATDYFDLNYKNKILGDPLVDGQPLCYPTDWFVDPVPQQLKNGISELANIALTEDLFFTPTLDESGKIITRKLETVGPITEETEYATSNTVDIQKKKFPKAEKWFALVTSGGGGGVIR
jgi:hypothetical protein